MRRCVSDGGGWAAVGGTVTVAVGASVSGAVAMAVDATGVGGSGVLDDFTVGGTLDCFVADFCVAELIGVRVAASDVLARFVAAADVGVTLGAAGSIGLGLTVESTSATGVMVIAFTDGDWVGVIWSSAVGTNGPK